MCLQATAFPVLVGACWAQLFLAFGCSVLAPALAGGMGILCPAQVTATLHPLLSPHMFAHCRLHGPGHLVSWPPNICPEQWP